MRPNINLFKALAPALAIGLTAANARAQCELHEETKLVASDAATGDDFGGFASLSVDTAVVGAYKDDNAGSVYVYVREGGIWTHQQKLTAFDAVAGDWFGWSVSVSGDTAVVGANHDDNAGVPWAGSAYVYVRKGGIWTHQQKLTAMDVVAENDFFGRGVSVSGDTAVIGATGNDVGGSAYVFVRSGGVWTQQQKLTPFDAEDGGHFGEYVSVSGDTTVIGARGPNVGGSAYVFVRSGGVWTQQQKLIPFDAEAGDNFGKSVSVSGDTAVIGAPRKDLSGPSSDNGAAYVFFRSGGVWAQQQKLTASIAGSGDWFGYSVSLNGDTAVAGAIYGDGPNPDTGLAYVFVRAGGVWTEQAKLTASDAAVGDRFGFAVSASGDTLLVGANNDDHGGPGSGSAYVFDLGPDCNANAIPDECDIADCPPNDPGCADDNKNGVPDGCDPAIPTVSHWGTAVMVLLLVACGTIIFEMRRWSAYRETSNVV